MSSAVADRTPGEVVRSFIAVISASDSVTTTVSLPSARAVKSRVARPARWSATRPA